MSQTEYTTQTMAHGTEVLLVQLIIFMIFMVSVGLFMLWLDRQL